MSNASPISLPPRSAVPLTALIALGLGLLCVLATLVTQVTVIEGVSPDTSRPLGAMLGLLGVLLVFVVVEYRESVETRRSREHIESIAEQLESLRRQLREHPQKPLLAWEAAQKSVQLYIDRHLGQLASIRRLTLLILVSGFAILLLGLYQSAQSPDRLPVALVVSTAGAITVFVGGSFLLTYRSLFSQAGDHATVLERLNAVGMAIQVMGSISDPELKDDTTADVVKKVLALYAPAPAEPARPARLQAPAARERDT